MKRLLSLHSNAVWPPLGLVALFVVTYGVLDAGLWLVEKAVPNVSGGISDMPEIMNIRSGILETAAGLFAAFRLWRFHPACNTSYAWWLSLTPWTADKPLPMGPVQLVWQDALVLGSLAAFARWRANVNPVLPMIAFGMVY